MARSTVSMSRATSSAVDALHGLVAASMTEELERAIARAQAPAMIDDPENPRQKIRNPNHAPLSAQFMSVVIKFLKDNGIDAPTSSPRLSNLVDQLRTLEVGDEAVVN